ncbi:PQQ-binding-like beta-propeller repeat protein [Tsukamurella sp. PLM1]|uniref:outer membrane protein assembly factor BamB family protein n=1 Tax=Tsukamurella sp. PLM1 TaxID=2929795 RepID=UPI0020BE570E|nr:PQQ-binding-like beta-propeller repeat protein [Tsukamurella sp. PLM1]
MSVVCVVVLVAGGIYWWHSRPSDGDSGPVPGQLTAEFPTAPSVAWTVRPSDVGASTFFSTNFTASQYGSPGGATDGRFVLTGAEVNGRSTVVGIDAAGRAWVPDQSLACADQVVAGRTACRVSQSDDSRVFIADLAGRTVSAGVPASDKHFGMVAYNGEAAFRTSDTSIMRVTASGVEWSRPVTMPESPGGDFHAALATRSLVSFYYGGAAYVASAGDGTVLHTYTGNRARILPNGGMVVADSGSGTNAPITVIAPAGEVLHPGRGTVGVPTVASPGLAGAVIVDGVLHDAAGSALWSASVSASTNNRVVEAPLVSTRVTVLESDSGYLGIDTATGRELWRDQSGIGRVGSSGGTSALTDGRYLIFPSGTELVAIDTTTGRRAWSIPSPLGSGEQVGALLAVGDTLVVVGKNAVVGYKATGGAARAPGTSTGTPAEGSGSDEYYTRCGSKPVFTPQKFRTESDGLVVTMKITATCPGGDALTSAGTAVTISDSAGVIASGTFDFATNAIGVPKPEEGDDGQKAGTTVDLLFRHGQFFRTPDTLPPAHTGNGSSGAGGPGGHQYLVDCVQPDSGTGRARVPAPSAPPIGSTGPGPQSGLNPQSGLSALRIQADSDKAFILGSLNDHWVAQLSSKRVGLVADGRTWDEKAILDEFLALRLRFADVRLLYSDEWPVFNYKGWWVTVAAATFPGPDEANRWCAANGFDRDHCFAKLVSSTAGSEGSTRYR